MIGSGFSRGTWIAVAVAGVVVSAIIAIVVALWNWLGASEISPLGWLAMALGVLVTLGLGVGLMTLMFYSNRHGYD